MRSSATSRNAAKSGGRRPLVVLAVVSSLILSATPVGGVHGFLPDDVSDDDVERLVACIEEVAQDVHVPDENDIPDPGEIHGPEDVEPFVDEVMDAFGVDEDKALGCTQAVAPDPFAQGNVTITEYTVSNPLTLDEPNTVSGTIENQGDVPVFAHVKFSVRNEARSWEQRKERRDNNGLGVRINGSEEKTVTFTWDGRVPPTSGDDTADNVPLWGQVDIRYEVNVTGAASLLDHDEQTTSRRMMVHNVSLTRLDETKPGETVKAGSSTGASLLVQSEGNADDVVALEVVDHTPGWDVKLSKDTLSIPHEDPATTIDVTLTAPEDAVAKTNGSAEIRAWSKKAPTADRSRNTTEITSPPVEQENNLTIDFGPTSAAVEAVEAEQDVSTEVTVKNVGNAPLTVSAVLVPSGPEWNQAADPAEQDLQPADETTFTVNATVPADAEAGTYEWDVRVVPDEGNIVEATDPFVVEVPQWYRVGIAKDDLPATIVPGDDAPLQVQVTNEGNGPDDLALELVDAPPGWELGPSGGTTFHLEADSAKAVSVLLRTPSTTEPGTESFGIRVRSVNASEKFKTVHHSVDVLPRVYPEVTVDLDACEGDEDPCKIPIEPNATATVPLVLRNDGNVEDTLTLKNDTTFQGPNNGWQVRTGPAEVTLGPGASASGELEIESPDQLDIDDNAEVELNLSASNDHRDGGDWGAERTVVAESAFPDLIVTDSQPSPDPLYRDLPDQELALTVKNNGTSGTGNNATLDVAFLEPGDDVDGPVAQETAEIPTLGWKPGDRSAQVTVSVPSGFPELKVETVVDSLNDTYERGEDNNDDFEETLPFRSFNITLDAPTSFKAEPGQAVSLEGDRSFTVTNQGDQVEALNASLAVDPPWIEETWDFSVPPGESGNLTTNLVVPDRPGVTEANFTVHLKHPTHDALNRSASLILQVNDTHPPTIAAPTVTGDPVVDVPVTFSAEIEDATGLAETVLVLTAPSGAVQEFEMTYDPDRDAHVLEHTFQEPGTYEWYVRAVDASPEAYRSDTADDPGTIEVLPGAAPELELVRPQAGATIQPGEWIAVSVSVPAGRGLESASYVLDGSTSELSPTDPLQINTASWTEGERTVEVRVVDALGSSTSAEYAFTVDGTPPEISMSIEPGTPTPGGDLNVTATVDDASEVATVTLRVGFGDGSGEDVAMNLTGDTYHALVTDPDGRTLSTLTVIAEDAAGNQGSAEQSFGSAGPRDTARGTLPLDPVVIVAGIGAAVLLTYWRRETES